MIIRSTAKLLKQYSQLGPGDVFVGKVPSGMLKHTLLIDFLERGIHCLPAPLSQIINGSKAAQAMLLAHWMLPLTRVIRRRADMFEAMGVYHGENIGSVITKEDRMHCGHGIRRWESIEALYNMVAFNKSSFPFVLQPYQESFTDLRVIIVDTYIEAYIRQNSANFRMNLSAGGESQPYIPTDKQLEFCRDVIQRARFPYAHLDLMELENECCYLSEISLDGGIKGAKINRTKLEALKGDLLNKMVQDITGPN